MDRRLTIEEVTVGGLTRQSFSLNVVANGGGAALGCGTPGAAVRRAFIDAADTEVGSVTSSWDNTRLIPINSYTVTPGDGGPRVSRLRQPAS